MDPRTVHCTLRELLNTPNTRTVAISTQALLTMIVITVVSGASLRHCDAVFLAAICIARRPRPHTVHWCHRWCHCRCRSGLGCGLRCWAWGRWCSARTFPSLARLSDHTRIRTVLATDAMDPRAVHSTLCVLLIAFIACRLRSTHIRLTVDVLAIVSTALLCHRDTVQHRACRIASRP